MPTSGDYQPRPTSANPANNPDGHISLREAVLYANHSAGSDTIELGMNASRAVRIALEAARPLDAYGGDLDIYGGTGNVRITGNTGTETIRQTVLGYRVFEVYNTGDLTLDGLTITGGDANNLTDGYNGGGIAVYGSAAKLTSTIPP